MWQIINNFFGNIFLALGGILFARIILNKPIQVSKSRLIVDFLLTIISYTTIMIYFDGTVKTLLMGITLFLLDKDLFKETFQKTIFLTFLCMIILIIPELLGLGFLIKVLKMSKKFCYNEFAGSIICNLIVQILFIIITLILKNILRKLVNEKIITNTKIIIFSVLTLICSGMFFYTLIKELRFSNNIFLYLVAIIVLVSVLFSLIKQMRINNNLTKEYDNLLQFMTTYENEIEKQRILRHEVKNEFRTIKAKICDNQENKEIIEYIDEIVKDKYEINKEKYAKFGYLPPNGIKGLCYFKMQKAEEKGIKVSLNISKRIKETTIYNLTLKEQRDFGRILGVFLDNAIEASEESKEKQIGIEAYINSEKEFRMIITNTYKNKIDKSKIGLESFSTKGKTRGHGLLLVKQLVGKNKKFEIKRDIKENIYIQTIEIKKL